MQRAKYLCQINKLFPGCILSPIQRDSVFETFLNENEFDFNDNEHAGENILIWMFERRLVLTQATDRKRK